MSMKDQLPKSMHGTCRDILNAISSLASEAGALLSNSPDGPQTDLFGPALAPANHSAPQEKDLPKPTSAISGPPSSISSASAALSMSLGSRLQARLGTAGSMEYRQTWKQKATPAGRPYWAHIPSTRPINDSGSTGWPTPDTGSAGGRVSRNPGAKTRPSGTKAQLTLNDAVRLTGWTTPDARAMNDGENLETWDARQAKNKEKHGNGNGAGMPIAIQCKTIVGWCSPTVTDADRGVLPPRPQDTGIPLTQQVSGLTSNSSTAEMGKPAASQLNPHFSRWLMGFPPEWCACADTAMQSFPKSRRSSSKHTTK
jgi:hypothetical protein